MPKATWTITAVIIAAAFPAILATVLADPQAQASTAVQAEAAESPSALRMVGAGPLSPDPAVRSGAPGDGGDHGWPGSWWIIMPIMMVLFWGGLLGVAVWAVRQFTGNRSARETPLDIARERRAQGEISAEEFEEIRRDLA